MTHFSSDITGHMRLFELLRQQNIAADRRERDAVRAPSPPAAELDSFLDQAARSLRL